MKITKPTSPYLSLLLIAAFLISSCADAPQRSHEESEENTESTEEIVEETETMEEDNSFMLPSPIQIAAMFNRAGLQYKSGLTNDPSNLEMYNTKTAKYLNFGVYSADLAYVVLNSQQQASLDYLGAVKTLTDEIGMPSIFGTGELVKSFERNIDNQDSILMILTIIKQRTDEYLLENQEKSKESIFFSSAWVEGMYLGANSPTDKSKITPRLLEQMTILEDIIKALRVQRDPSLEIDFLISGLTELLNTFNGFESVKKLDSEEVSISDITLTDAELKTLTEKINAIRTQIVNG